MELLYILAGAIVLDLLFGDPRTALHPVAVIGNSALKLENFARKYLGGGFFSGMCCATIIVGVAALAAWTLTAVGMSLSYYLGLIVSMAMVYITIAPGSLISHAVQVKKALEINDLPLARKRVAMIVSRDTEVLEESGVIRSCIESVGENIVDGVTSALFFAGVGWLLGGAAGAAAGAFLLRAANTLDATYGYKNERYRRFGTCAARLDDALHFIPARLTLLAIFLAAQLSGLRGVNAVKYAWRDRRKHPSPNSTWGMAAFAGALGVKLGGPTRYKGEWKEYPAWGEEFEKLHIRHIDQANRLVLRTTVIFALLTVLLAALIKYWM